MIKDITAYAGVCCLGDSSGTIAGWLTRWLQFFRRCLFKDSFPLRN
jgi:hypothetical protein